MWCYPEPKADKARTDCHGPYRIYAYPLRSLPNPHFPEGGVFGSRSLFTHTHTTHTQTHTKSWKSKDPLSGIACSERTVPDTSRFRTEQTFFRRLSFVDFLSMGRVSVVFRPPTKKKTRTRPFPAVFVSGYHLGEYHASTVYRVSSQSMISSSSGNPSHICRLLP